MAKELQTVPFYLGQCLQKRSAANLFKKMSESGWKDDRYRNQYNDFPNRI